METANSPGLTPLITGIINDAQALVRQQLTLFQTEVKKDINKSKEAAVPFGIGLMVSLLAGIFLLLTAAHFLVWLWPELPLFAAYGIVGIILAIVGGSFLVAGKTKFASFTPIPEKSVEGLKENIQWTTKT